MAWLEDRCSKVVQAPPKTFYFFLKLNFIIHLKYLIENISQYLEKCELVINLKKGKIESMLLGTAKNYQRFYSRS